MLDSRALILLIALLMIPWHAGAKAPLLLPTRAQMLDAAGDMQRLDDPKGTLNALEASQSPDWVSLPGSLSAGYTDAVVWLRLRLDAPSAGQWMLQPSNALLDDVQMYMRSPGSDRWQFMGISGEGVPRYLWPVDFRTPALQLNLAQAGEYSVLLRLSTRNALTTRLIIWPRLAFDNHTRREGLLFGLYFGFYILLICLHMLFWRATSAPLSGLFLAYLSSCLLNEVLSLGLIQQITGIGGAWSDRLLGVSIACSLPIGARMACAQMALGQTMPRTARTLIFASTATGAAGAALILLGRYGLGIMPVQLMGLLLMAVLIGLALRLLRRGSRRARFFVFVFGFFYLSVLVAYLRNLGVFPVNLLTEHISALGTMVHMVLLSLWLIGTYVHQHHAQVRMQIYLEAELAQAQQRKDTLERALELERRMRQEQRDFVAMVSHEFRTPLAIIDSSAQQLARNASAPPQKMLARAHNIRNATKRMRALVDDCLADDRMAEPDLVELHRAPCDLHALIRDLTQDFRPGRIDCRFGDGTRHIATDAALLRIALRNLLANADRHAPANSSVQLHVERDGDLVTIDIANAADPIPSEDQRQLFERYYRGRSARHSPGVGLGLYLVRCIADKLGGSVTLTSTGGAMPVCFRIALPMDG